MLNSIDQFIVYCFEAAGAWVASYTGLNVVQVIHKNQSFINRVLFKLFKFFRLQVKSLVIEFLFEPVKLFILISFSPISRYCLLAAYWVAYRMPSCTVHLNRQSYPERIQKSASSTFFFQIFIFQALFCIFQDSFDQRHLGLVFGNINFVNSVVAILSSVIVHLTVQTLTTTSK